VTDEMKARAAEMFAAGSSVNAVSKELAISWLAARALDPRGPAKTGGKRKKAKKRAALAVREDASAGDGDEADDDGDCEITLRMPLKRLDDALATFTRQEKCDAVATMLQGRLDAALENG
jgi:hypothetical protein